MFKHEKSYFLANSKIKSFYILLYNGLHIISLKYDNFTFYCAVVTKKLLNGVIYKGIIPLRWNSK